MKYKLTEWSIRKLSELIDQERICLSPPYQRNSVWTKKAQRLLIKTIKSSQPIPNFFLLQTGEGSYEMVDGQQRARTILAYLRANFDDSQGVYFDKDFSSDPKNKTEFEDFMNYSLSITIIEEKSDDEPIEAYYALVNSSGLRLNRPELKKAEYYNTNFLRLITDLADYPDFRELNLFTVAFTNRMNDIDFVSELVALIKYGFSDKKEKVDDIFDDDITDEDYESLSSVFKEVVTHFKRFNSIVPLKVTRFRQKNDFYSFFALILNNPDITNESLDYFYRLLLKISKHIKPSQEECDPLMNYALNCVTQSNSKQAREKRNTFLVNFLLNKETAPNKTQAAILKFFNMKDTDMVELLPYFTLDIKLIRDPDQPELQL